MVENEAIHVLDHKVRLYQAANGFRTSMDSVFVAAACPAQGGRVLDLGCGVGGASFCLLWRVCELHLTGVDIQSSHIDLAWQNAALNDMAGRADFVHGDIAVYQDDELYDHAICNPPFLEAGAHTPSPLPERATALGHGTPLFSLKDWLDCGFRNLKSGGTFTIIQRGDMVDKIIQGLGKRFGAIEIIPLYPKAGEDARRVIVRAIKDRKTPARLHAGITLHEADGRHTPAADAILRDGAAIA